MRNSGRTRSGLRADGHIEEVICPKPRRIAASCTPELIKPSYKLWCSSSAGSEYDAVYEILEILQSKNAYGESPNIGCSPPSRAGNPLVHDIQFIHQRLPPPATLAQPKPLGGSSHQAAPSIRIEGFDCSGRDSCCSIPALA
eukprot:c21137_g1_i4 orf=360-785(+)